MNLDSLTETASNRLLYKLKMGLPVLSAAAEQIWCSEIIHDLYPVYLQRMHMISRSAVPLMERAIEAAQKCGRKDKIALALIEYLQHHKEEELGHDKWLLEDLQAAGGNAKNFSQIPSPKIATFVGAQYYWLFHHHPVSLLGHIAVVESFHPSVGFAERLQTLTGYPKEAFRSIRRHATLDLNHKKMLFRFIDSLPLEIEHEKMMGISGLYTIQTGIDVLNEIYEEGSRKLNSN